MESSKALPIPVGPPLGMVENKGDFLEQEALHRTALGSLLTFESKEFQQLWIDYRDHERVATPSRDRGEGS